MTKSHLFSLHSQLFSKGLFSLHSQLFTKELSSKIHLFSLHSKLFSKGLFTKLLLFTLLSSLFTACGTMRQVEIGEHATHDTIYFNKVQYDSVYVYQNISTDRLHDTVYIRDIQYQYKYKLLRDTCYVHQVDSIPVIREVEVTKEVMHIPWWSKMLNWIGGISLLVGMLYVGYKIMKVYLR